MTFTAWFKKVGATPVRFLMFLVDMFITLPFILSTNKSWFYFGFVVIAMLSYRFAIYKVELYYLKKIETASTHKNADE